MTFTEGIPCLYPARVGRSCAGAMVQQDFPQVLLVKMLKEGLLKLPAAADEQTGFSRLANLLRGLAIGRGRDGIWMFWVNGSRRSKAGGASGPPPPSIT